MLKLGGGFYVGKVDSIYVVNGFYVDMRSRFTKAGASIFYFTAEWSADKLSWEDFRGKLLGATDPSVAEPGSIRNTVFKDWRSLGLTTEPDTGYNGVHASASPFEGFCERCNWLGTSMSEDPFGKALVDKGVPLETIKAFMDDPPVNYEGKTASVFDQLEDLNRKDCLEKVAKIALASDAGAAEGKNLAFVFIKPHAVTAEVKDLVRQKMSEAGVSLTSEGEIAAETIDKKMLIDTHYGAIAAKAMKLKPESLAVQPQARDLFKSKFGLEWQDALSQNLVYNTKDACQKLGTDYDGVFAKWSLLKKGETMLKLGGGFYVGKVESIYVVNGFYVDMRSRFTKPGASIFYFTAEWSADKLSWEDFRGKLLGATDPSVAEPGSIRNTVFKDWRSLGLTTEPDTGYNGVHASASPFEGFCERCNWLGTSLSEDPFGKALVDKGVPLETIKAFMDDPPVNFEGKTASIFDQLEDLNRQECLEKVVKMACSSSRAAAPEAEASPPAAPRPQDR